MEFIRDFEQFKDKYQLIFATTLETDRYPDGEIISNAPDPKTRAIIMRQLKLSRPDIFRRLIISVEPVMDFNTQRFADMILSCDPELVSIGADSKGHNLNEPNTDKLTELINTLNEFTDVNLKANLNRLLR